MNGHDSQIRQQLLHLPLLHTQNLAVLGQVGRGLGQHGVGTRVLDPRQPGTVRNLPERGAVGRHRPQHALDEQLARVGHVVGDPVGPLEDAALQPAHVVPVERHGGRRHEVQQDAQRPDVGEVPAVTLVLEELGRGVRRRAAEVGEQVAGAALGAEAKVPDLDAVAGGEEDVLRLQVSVDDVVVVLKR